MTSLVFVAGARPNFMKVAPILKALADRHPSLTATLVHTGQHYDYGMSEIFFQQLGIREPDAHLSVGSGSHGAQTGKIMIAFEEHLLAGERPSGVVVVGDVNSTMACTLVAVKLGVPVAHVEAGLRSGDRAMPEEINRIVTDSVADLLLVSDPAGLDNLAKEGVDEHRVRYVGNVMIDSLVQQLPEARALNKPGELGLEREGYALVTFHRPSNVDSRERLEALVAFLAELSRTLTVIFPVHPRTAAKLEEHGLRDALERESGILLSEPVGYVEILSLMEAAKLVISDSGGIQEETTYLGVPCITLRDSTERPVTVTLGTNTVVGRDIEAARRAVGQVLDGKYRKGQTIDGWDGRAAERVVDTLASEWC